MNDRSRPGVALPRSLANGENAAEVYVPFFLDLFAYHVSQG